MTTQHLIILDGPLESQETYEVNDRLMRLYSIIELHEIETQYFGKKQIPRKVKTGNKFKYQITSEGLRYAQEN